MKPDYECVDCGSPDVLNHDPRCQFAATAMFIKNLPITPRETKTIPKDHYDRMVSLIISGYLNTETHNFHGNHLAERGLREFLQELGEWQPWMEKEHEKVKKGLL